MEPTVFTSEQRSTLLDLSRNAILSSLHPWEAGKPQPEPWLEDERASFVTLKKQEQLRGCIGSLHPVRSLLDDIWHNAQAAAFSDPRFPPVTEEEFEQLDIELSVLTEVQPLTVSSEQELLSTLRPGIDGLIIEDGLRRATFLPSVWEQLSQPQSFLDQLRLKAGMPAGHWSDTMTCSVYQVEKIK